MAQTIFTATAASDEAFADACQDGYVHLNAAGADEVTPFEPFAARSDGSGFEYRAYAHFAGDLAGSRSVVAKVVRAGA